VAAESSAAGIGQKTIQIFGKLKFRLSGRENGTFGNCSLMANAVSARAHQTKELSESRVRRDFPNPGFEPGQAGENQIQTG
jgi:hypothetical protein